MHPKKQKKKSSSSAFKMLNSKKGMFLQIVMGIVVIFAVGFIWLSSFVTQSLINDEIQSDTSLSNSSKAVMQDQTDAMPSVFDSGVGLVMALLFLLVFAFAYKPPSNPVFLFAAILIISAFGFVGMILGNGWEEFSDTDGISVYANSFPITNFILSNFLIIILVLSFGSVMVYFYSTGGLG